MEKFEARERRAPSLKIRKANNDDMLNDKACVGRRLSFCTFSTRKNNKCCTSGEGGDTRLQSDIKTTRVDAGDKGERRETDANYSRFAFRSQGDVINARE